MAARETDTNQGENTGTYSNRTLGGTDFRVEPPEHTSCSLLRSRRCSDPNPAPVGDADWLWFQVIGQKRDSRQVRRKTPRLELCVFAAPASGAEG